MRAASAATPEIVLPAITPALILLLVNAVSDALAATVVGEDLPATVTLWDVLRVLDWELEDAEDVVEALEELLPVVLALEDIVVEGTADIGVKFTPV
jgi:hypothetical protein